MPDRRLLTISVALLACGLIAAGCGGDDEPKADSTPETSITEDSSTSEDGSGEDASSSDSSSSNTIEEAIAQCKELAENSGLEGDLKDSAISACENAGNAADDAADAAGAVSGDALEQAKKTCLSIAESLSDDQGRESAISACNGQFGGE